MNFKLKCISPLQALYSLVYFLGFSLERKVHSSEVVHNDHQQHSWSKRYYCLNKTIKTTIVSEHVRKDLLDDIEFFMNNEEYYAKHGIPYKRGYLLHGEPGTGKTSIIKAFAALYSIPIFIVDCNMFKTNDKFVQMMDNINNFTYKKKHIVIFEDIDRTLLFMGKEGTITKDCFLNAIDGVDEQFGRIVFLTANDISSFDQFPALLRYGRIDVKVKFTYCTIGQIVDIFKLYEFEIVRDKLNSHILITPSNLIQLVHYFKSIDKIVKCLNKHVNFTNFDLHELILLFEDHIFQ